MPIRRLLLIVTALAALVGGAPLWPWLDLPLQLLLPVAFLLGLGADLRERTLLPARFATLFMALAFVWYASQVSRSEIVAPATNLLALLLALRLLTEKSGRHLLQIFILALLALAASSLYSLGSSFLLFLVWEILAIAFGLLLLCYAEADPAARLGRRPLRAIIVVGLGLPLVSLLFVPPLFFILPRTQFPLWTFLPGGAGAHSGITDHVEPGAVSSLAGSRRIVLRVEAPRQAPDDLYWRVIVLNTPEGKGWVRRPPPVPEVNLSGKRQRVEQLLYIEPTGERFLPILDTMEEWRGVSATRTPDGLLMTARPFVQRQRLQAISRIGGRLQSPKDFPSEIYLSLPLEVTPRLRRLAEGFIAKGDSSRRRVLAIEDFFRQQGLNYSTTNLPGGDHPLDDFLFSRKSGYCEHFALAFATMLRLAGVPSRLVGGYYGGEYSELGGYYLIREDRAHLWVEALVDGYWERIDPTRLAKNAESVATEQSRSLSGISSWLDAFNYYWNRTIINYDLHQQLDWLQRRSNATRRWDSVLLFKKVRTLLPLLAGIAGSVLFLRLVIPWLRRSPEERLLRRFLRRLRQAGVKTEDPSLGLRTLAALHPHPAARVFAGRYNAIVFSGKRASAVELRELNALLRQLRG